MERQLKSVRMVFLDMDGTIYHGGTLFPTTLPFLEFLRKRGIGYAFLSNNSSYSTEEYVAKLHRMGIETTAENFYTSTCYTIDFLKRNHPEIKRIHLFGMPCIRPEFTAAGFEFDDETPQAVIVAFHRAFHYDDLCRTAYLLRISRPGCRTAGRSPAAWKCRPTRNSRCSANPIPACCGRRPRGTQYRLNNASWPVTGSRPISRWAKTRERSHATFCSPVRISSCRRTSIPIFR